MRALIFVPTYRYGGLDVLLGSLNRQDYRKFDIVVLDELIEKRKHLWRTVFSNGTDYNVRMISVAKKEGNLRNLARGYNIAADIAVQDNYDLFISLQDYIWLPENGVKSFVEALERFPTDIYTGVTHISRDPFPNQIHDKNGLFTIFKEPYYEKPRRLSWEDVRIKEIYKRAPENSYIMDAEPAHWEANWSAVPVSLLKQGLRWDEEYDVGVAYENMDFAQRARRDFGAKVVFDTSNVAISLPHKDYFDGEREEIKKFSNRGLYESKWN